MITNAEILKEKLYAHILEADRRGAAELLGGAVSAYGYPPVISELLEPVLALVGERFMVARLSLAQGYVAGKIAEDLLERLDASAQEFHIETPRRGVAVIGNAEDDYHSLGRRMLGSFLKIAGWTIVDLGNDVLPGIFVDRAEECGARIIGVSAMMLTNALNIAQVREEIEKRGLGGKIKLAVGGAVFIMRPELVAEAGGDGSARTAMEAPALFDRLLKESTGALR